MSDVINWAIGGGVVVFAIGLFSALGSRLQRRRSPLKVQSEPNLEYPRSLKSNRTTDAALDLAASGNGNFVSAIKVDTGEKNLAESGSHSR